MTVGTQAMRYLNIIGTEKNSMAYNNGFPMNYQQMYYPQQTTQSSGIIWVQGEAGAKSYLVAPGQSVLLMDSESETFYIKSTDASGMPMPLRKFSYKEVLEAQKKVSGADFNPSLYVTREELESRLKSLKMSQDGGSLND